MVNRFEYRAIWLMDYETQIRSGELAALAPFLLEIVDQPTEETVQTAKSLAATEPDSERRGLLLSLVALLAGRYFDREIVREMFRTAYCVNAPICNHYATRNTQYGLRITDVDHERQVS